MATRSRVLIIAGHPGVRADLRTILQLADGIEVVGEADCLREAIEQARALSPDVALVDLEMASPGEDGHHIVAEIKAQRLVKAVAVLTAHDYPTAREYAARCGADAILIKGADFNAMLDAIRKIS